VKKMMKGQESDADALFVALVGRYYAVADRVARDARGVERIEVREYDFLKVLIEPVQ
jgi:hypothetical protein